MVRLVSEVDMKNCVFDCRVDSTRDSWEVLGTKIKGEVFLLILQNNGID